MRSSACSVLWRRRGGWQRHLVLIWPCWRLILRLNLMRLQVASLLLWAKAQTGLPIAQRSGRPRDSTAQRTVLINAFGRSCRRWGPRTFSAARRNTFLATCSFWTRTLTQRSHMANICRLVWQRGLPFSPTNFSLLCSHSMPALTTPVRGRRRR